LPVPSSVQRASRRSLPCHRGRSALLAILVGIAAAIAPPAPAAAAAATPIRVAIIVGPAGSATSAYRSLGDQAAAEARRYTPNVVRVYSPNATWSRVKAAVSGATIVVYLGRGMGFPSRYSTILQRATQDGFGLNPVAGVDNSTTRYYGEAYVRNVPLAPNAVVLLSRVPYASGDGELGAAPPTLSVARHRVDNYGAGFLAAGASVVIADSTSAPAFYIRAVFTRTFSLDAMWRGAPGANGHVTSFDSTRTSGAIGRTDPEYVAAGGYDRSIVGRLATSTATVRWSIAVPASIDATGATDASPALISFVNSVPDGSTIVFKAGGVYRMDAALKFAHRRNLIFEGNGATLRANGGTTEASSLFWLASDRGGNSGITIRDFTLAGNSSTPGVYQPGKEGAHGILVDSGSAIEITSVTVRGVWGDCLYVGSAATGVSFHDSTCSSNGRNGVTVTSATSLTVQRVTFTMSGYCTFDIEPNVSAEGASNVQFLDNTAGAWTNSFLSADGAAGSVVSGVTVSGNTVTGASLLTVIDLARRQNIVFTNNRSTVTAAGPVLHFAHVDGLTVTGNVQPLSSGVLASITDSTGVTYTP
jgi:hypothetical protein